MTSTQNLTVLCVTFNAGGQTLPSLGDLVPDPTVEGNALDVYALCFQELDPDVLRRYAEQSLAEDLTKEQRVEAAEGVDGALYHYVTEFFGGSHQLVFHSRQRTTQLVVVARGEHVIRDSQWSSIKLDEVLRSSFDEKLAAKRGLAAGKAVVPQNVDVDGMACFFQFQNTSLCFVGCCLKGPTDETVGSLLRGLSFRGDSLYSAAATDSLTVADHTFLLGDFGSYVSPGPSLCGLSRRHPCVAATNGGGGFGPCPPPTPPHHGMRARCAATLLKIR